MELIKKTAAIILREKKLFLVRGDKVPFWWTPGGKLEKDETPENCTKRELTEELNIKDIILLPYFEYLSENEEDGKPRFVTVFIVERYRGDISCSMEIKEGRWFSRDELLSDKYIIQNGVKDFLIPRIIKDDFL